MRPMTAPEIRAAVMMANVAWYDMYSRWGMLPLASRPTPRRNRYDASPIQSEPVEKASE